MKKMFILSVLIGQGMLHAAAANQIDSADILRKGAEFRDRIDKAIEKDPYLATLTENAYAVIEKIQKENNYQTIEPIFKAIYLDWLYKNPKERIIVSQRLPYLLSKIGIGLYKLPDIFIDISEYINKNGPIQELDQRKGTIAHCIRNRPFGFPLSNVHNRLYDKDLTILDLWSLPNLESIDDLVLTGNQITFTPGNFDSLENLRLLYLGKVNLNSLPNGIFENLKQLEMVNVDNNPIEIRDLRKQFPSLFNARTKAIEGQ